MSCTAPPPLWGSQADTINQKNVIIRLNTLRLHEHIHTHTQKQHYKRAWTKCMNACGAQKHSQRGPVYGSRVLQRFLGALFAQNALRLALFVGEVVKQKSVCYSSGGNVGINTHQCRCLSIYSHLWESPLCSVSNLLSGDPHLAGPILVGGFTWAPSKVHICLQEHFYSSVQWITVTCLLFLKLWQK